MRSLYDEIRDPKYAVKQKRKKRRAWLIPAVCAAVGLAVIALFQPVKGNRTLMNGVVRNVTTPFKRGVSHLCDVFSFSVAEILCVLVILAVLVFLVRSIYLLIRRDGKLRRLGRRALAALAALSLIYAGYTVLWGVNYQADGFSELSGIETRGATVEELATLTASFAARLNELTGEVSRDEDGVFNEDLDAIFSSTDGLYDGICGEFSFLSAPDRQPKRMIFSRLMSRMDFTGFFFPFTGEAVVNVDAPACLIPSTILHEMAHQRNIAAEDEANFVAILAGLRCDDPVFEYSSALLGFIHLGNALYSVSPDTYRAIRATVDPRVDADLAANNAYWAQFESPVDEALEAVSTTVFEGFLQSYGQSDGMKSYGKCVDLLVAYYFDFYWAAD